MITGKYFLGLSNSEEIERIRKEVFGDEQNIAPFSEMDEIDETAVHAVVYKDSEKSQPVAVGRLYTKMENISFTCMQIGRIAVRKSERGQGYGDFVVRMLVDKAFQMGAETVRVGAQKHAIAFYEKIGFQQNGESFTEAGIGHTVLELRKNMLCTKCHKGEC